MRRYNIVEGDVTTAGGVVQRHTGNGKGFIWHGRIASHIGDKVNCPACGSVGIIKAAGSRLSFDNHSLTPALHGDLCICKCNPPPVLKHSQEVMYQEVDSWFGGADVLSSHLVNTSIGNNWINFKLDDGFDYFGMPCILYFKDGTSLSSSVNENNVIEFKNFDQEDFDYLHFTDLQQNDSEQAFSDELLKKL